VVTRARTLLLHAVFGSSLGGLAGAVLSVDATATASPAPPVGTDAAASPSDAGAAPSGPTLEALILDALGDAASRPQPFAVSNTPEGRAAAASNLFGLELYVRARPAHGNVVLSPAGISTAMAMVLSGVEGPTRAEMATVLHLESIPDPDAAFARLMALAQSIDGRDGLVLHAANRLWPKGISLERDYADRMLAQFGAPSGEASVHDINAWVTSETHGRTTEILRALAPGDRLVLTSVVQFKGQWGERFDRTMTRDADFHGPTKVKKAPMMHRRLMTAYAHVDGTQVIDLPYRGALAMLIALPDAQDGLSRFEATLTQRYQDIRTALRNGSADVDLMLPRWTTSWVSELGAPLRGLGMLNAFRTGGDDFRRICSSKPIAISQVLHKSIIDVNEEGAEPPPMSVLRMRNDYAGHDVFYADPVHAVFHANHPFLYVIHERDTDAILLMGRVEDPAE
jgi:serine protease inhibitor